MKKKFKIIYFLLLVLLVFSFCQGNSPCFSFSSRVSYVTTYPEDHPAIKNDEPVDLVFYFHGAGGEEEDILKSFASGGLDLEKERYYRKNIVFHSFCYDTHFHWASPEITKDSIKKIQRISKKYNTRKIMLIGISSGGTLALNVLSLANNKLKNLISDILAVFPITDYEYTLSHNHSEWLAPELKKHFSQYSNPKKQMKESSPITFVSKIPSHTRIILIEGTRDKVVDSAQVERFYSEIKKINERNQLIKWNTDHDVRPSEKEFEVLVKDLLK